MEGLSGGVGGWRAAGAFGAARVEKGGFFDGKSSVFNMIINSVRCVSGLFGLGWGGGAGAVWRLSKAGENGVYHIVFQCIV